ncbi:MAG: phospho-sugar mutase, partial [Clostridia bacterium]|nr:phospho-sugar mutase [Clostridia bacterium]
MKLTETAKQNYEKWLACEKLDPETRAELESIRGNGEEIFGRFSSSLSFGTAGLRGVMAAGTARLNRYTVAQATQGLAQLIKKKRASARGVAIAYDS